MSAFNTKILIKFLIFIFRTVLYNMGSAVETPDSSEPSRVIHIRNLPNDVTEEEVIYLGIPFGRVNNVLVLKGKNQVSLPI